MAQFNCHPERSEGSDFIPLWMSSWATRFLRSEGSERAARCVAPFATQQSRAWLASLLQVGDESGNTKPQARAAWDLGWGWQRHAPQSSASKV